MWFGSLINSSRALLFSSMKPPESLIEAEDNGASVNTEVRFLTLELMKLAAKKGVSFEEVLEEYIENTCTLKQVLSAPYESQEEDFEVHHEFSAQKSKKKA